MVDSINWGPLIFREGCIKLPNSGKQSHRRQPKKYQRLPTSCFSVTLLNKVKEGSLDVKTKIPQFDSKYKNVSHSLQLLGTSSWVGGALNTEGALNIVMGIQRGHHYFIWGEFNLVFLPLGGRGRKDSYLCPGNPWAWPLLQVSAGAPWALIFLRVPLAPSGISAGSFGTKKGPKEMWRGPRVPLGP